jgi:hypothetical protein
MKTSEIIEARKNPELNPKVSVNQYIDRAFDSAKRLFGSDMSNLFVSFTAIPKLGINPQSTYNTPLGIYSYPGDYISYRIGSDKSMKNLPFAGEQPYAVLFSARGNNIVLNTYSPIEERLCYDKLRDYAKKLPDPKKQLIQMRRHTGKTWIEIVNNVVVAAQSEAKQSNISGGRLWYVTYILSEYLGTEYGRKPPIVWNELFRKVLDIDGCIDTGAGIIHPSEPTQAVFFSLPRLRILDIVYNKYSPVTVQDRIAQGDKAKKTFEQFKNSLARAIEKDDPRLITRYLDGDNINPDGWDYQVIFKYIPKNLRLKIYEMDSKNKIYSVMFWYSGKTLDPEEFQFAMTNDISGLRYAPRDKKTKQFLYQNRNRVINIFKSMSLAELNEISYPNSFVMSMLEVLPWDDPEYLKYLIMIDPDLPKYGEFKDLVKNSPNKKKIVAAIKNIE